MKTIMIVDDDIKVLNACQRILRRVPLRCLTFVSPVKALEQLARVKPAVVLADQYMPHMFGTAFFQQVEAILPESVRIIMTGHPDIDPIVSAVARGRIFSFIVKPWKETKLKSIIIQALDYYEQNQ